MPLAALLTRARRRWHALLHRAALEQELDDELQSHFQMEVDHLMRQGLSPEEARLRARREFGSVGRYKDEARDARGLRPLEELGRDIRVAARSLRRTPVFATVAALTLALGIGAATAVFSLVDGVLLRPLPYAEPSRLVRLYESSATSERMPFAGANARDVQAATRTLAGVAYFNRWPGTVLGTDQARRVPISLVSPGFFTVLGVPPLLGRVPAPGEDFTTGTPVALVSHRFWREALGAAPIAGRTLRIESDVVPVVGVMPPSFNLPSGADIWIPASDDNPHRTAHNWALVGRLAPGVTVDGARAELQPLMERLKADNGDGTDADGITIVGLHDDLARDARPLLLVLMGAVGFVLLVACVNLASASLARGESRRRELAVRAALGAGRARLVRLVLAEQLLVAAVGGMLGALLAVVLTRALLALGGGAVPAYAAVGVNARVLLFSAAVTVGAALLIALVPAWHAAGGNLRGAIAGGGERPAGAGGRRGGSHRVRALLVGTEVALALTLLAGAGLLVRSMRSLLDTDPGFRTDGVLTATVALPRSRYADSLSVPAYFARALDELRSIPGVRAAGVINAVPISGSGGNTAFAADGGTGMMGWADYRVVDSTVFRALGIPLLRGRGFGAGDVSGAPHVALVNQAFAQRFWPDGGPIGHRVRPPGMDAHADEWLTIVGVVGDVRGRTLDAAAQPALYVDVAQRPENLASSATFVLRADTPPTSLAELVRDRLARIDPEVPVRLQPLDDLVRRSLDDRRFSTIVLTSFAVLALFLAAIGIYGVLAFSVAQRQREIGVRMALGAHHGRVRGMVLGDAMRAVVPGVVVGLAAAAALTRLLRSLLYGVSGTDPVTFGAVALLLLGVAVLAAWLPARRATRVSPMLAIRAE